LPHDQIAPVGAALKQRLHPNSKVKNIPPGKSISGNPKSRAQSLKPFLVETRRNRWVTKPQSNGKIGLKKCYFRELGGYHCGQDFHWGYFADYPGESGFFQ
jgi:hypothetical protein